MKKFRICLLCITSLLMLAFVSYAWLTSTVELQQPFSATTVAQYFAGGDGSEASPYEIKTPKHLYNLTWLQNKGVFDNTTVYFKLTGNIDMSSDSSVTGAIPPIGTTDHPFTGYFNGDGYKISNLWVSSDENDWYEKPDTVTRGVGVDIGLFGAIAKNDTGPTYVGNFYLQNIEVTTHVSGDVGIVAGKLDAAMSQVGVINAKISAKNSPTIASRFSLIGETTEDVFLKDLPIEGGAGGDLSVQPSNTDTTSNYYIYKAFNDNGSLKSDQEEVPGSLSGTAYFYSTINRITVNGGIKNLYFHKETLAYSNTTVGTSSTEFNQTADSEEKNEFSTHYDTYQSNAYILTMGGKPNIAVGANADSLENCVWFKPQAAGKCALVFLHQSNNTNGYMALYRFKRDSVTNLITEVQEMQFFLSSSYHKNKAAVYYEIQLTEADLAYEYAIGIGSSNGSLANEGFFYMMLAGTDTSGGGIATDGTDKILEKIDFLQAVPENKEFPKTTHTSAISIELGEVSGTQNFYYNAYGTPDKVYYYTDGTVAQEEQVASGAQSQQESSLNPNIFPPITNP